MNPEELNLFLGVHGPNKIPKIKDCIHLKVQPYLEVKSRVDPNLPPRIYELGDQSTLNIIGLVDFKKLADKRRKSKISSLLYDPQPARQLSGSYRQNLPRKR